MRPSYCISLSGTGGYNGNVIIYLQLSNYVHRDTAKFQVVELLILKVSVILQSLSSKTVSAELVNLKSESVYRIKQNEPVASTESICVGISHGLLWQLPSQLHEIN